MSKRFKLFLKRKGVYIPEWAFEAHFKAISNDNISWLF